MNWASQLFHHNKCSIRAFLLPRQLWYLSSFSLAVNENYMHAQQATIFAATPTTIDAIFNSSHKQSVQWVVLCHYCEKGDLCETFSNGFEKHMFDGSAHTFSTKSQVISTILLKKVMHNAFISVDVSWLFLGCFFDLVLRLF